MFDVILSPEAKSFFAAADKSWIQLNSNPLQTVGKPIDGL
jgi:hypothetical protein